MELSNLQEKILNAPEAIVFCMASVGSGKTRLLTEKVKQSVEAGKNTVAFTFTNMAAAEMKARTGFQNSENLFIGTIHSYCAYLLLRRGVVEALDLINKEDFNGLFTLFFQHPECVPEIDICLCDEAQDSDEAQCRFIFEGLKTKEYFVVFDLRQSIYGFSGSRPDLLIKYGREIGAKFYSMNVSYRCAKEILGFAGRTLLRGGMADDTVGARKERGSVDLCSYSKDTIASYLFDSTLGDFGDWAIITRTNAQIQQITSLLKEMGVPYDTFCQGDLKKEELDTRMNANTVKVLTSHSSKGLEWRNVICLGLWGGKPEEDRISYVAITRAKDLVVWMKAPRKKKVATW